MISPEQDQVMRARMPQETQSSSPSSPNDPSARIKTSQQLSTGAAIGVAIAVVAGAALIATSVAYIVLRRRRRNAGTASNPASTPPSPGLRALNDVASINPLARMTTSDSRKSQHRMSGPTVQVTIDHRKRSSTSTDPIANIPREWAARLPKDFDPAVH